jgi:RNA polymerase sigma-70 factor (ECF subfamily)
MCELLEEEMVRAAAAGDRSAMDRLLRKYSPRMQRQLNAYGLDAEERADVLQEALVKIVRGLSSFRQDARLSTWIFALTANEALMMLRVKRRSTARVVAGLALEELGSLPATDDSRQADAALCAARGAARVHRELERLPSTYRAVLVAHYLDELALDDAGQRLGLSTSAVKARLWRARRSMRAALERAERPAAA